MCQFPHLWLLLLYRKQKRKHAGKHQVSTFLIFCPSNFLTFPRLNTQPRRTCPMTSLRLAQDSFIDGTFSSVFWWSHLFVMDIKVNWCFVFIFYKILPRRNDILSEKRILGRKKLSLYKLFSLVKISESVTVLNPTCLKSAKSIFSINRFPNIWHSRDFLSIIETRSYHQRAIKNNLESFETIGKNKS